MYKYICPVDLDFVTLDDGTVYYSLFNTYTKNIGINKISIQTMSATGSGNTKCMYAIARASGTTPTAGTAVAVTKMHTSNPTINLTIRRSNTGISMAGVSVDPYFFEIAVRTGSDGSIFEHTFNDTDGLIISPGQGIVILADGAGISGGSLHGSIELSLRE